MKYHIVSEKTILSLEAEVNRHIKMGWEPQGGVTTQPAAVGNPPEYWTEYFQAMVMKEEDE